MNKYVSIDLETTGLNPETCQILSFGAVIEDRDNKLPIEELPKFHRIIKHDFIKGEPYALNLNKDIIEIIKDGKSEELIKIENFTDSFCRFLLNNSYKNLPDNDYKFKINVTGKNFAMFDNNWLYQIPDFRNLIKISHRVLDPAPLYMTPEDEWLPNLQTCMDRAGIKSEVTHNALQDCIDVIKVLRFKGI